MSPVAEWSADRVKSSRPYIWFSRNYATLGFVIAVGAFALAGLAITQNGHQDRDRDARQTEANIASCERGNVLRGNLVESNVEVFRTVIITLGEDPAEYQAVLDGVRASTVAYFPPVDCGAVADGDAAVDTTSNP